MKPEQLKFVNDVVGIQTDLEQFTQGETEKRAAFDQAMAGLNGQKDTIRKAMQVRLVDKHGKQGESSFSEDGQEYALDTFKATRKGQGLTKEDMKQVGEAMRPIAEAARAILQTKGRDGKPLYKSKKAFEAALTQELFTPLVREGVLPENFVIDQYSEVQQLLDETFAAYKKTNEDERDEREETRARDKGQYYGAGSGTDKVSARFKALGQLPDKAMAKVGLDSETKRRRFGIGVAVGKMGMDIYSMGKTLDSWQVDAKTGMPKIEKNFDEQLHPEKYGFKDADPDEARSKIVEAKRAVKFKGYAEKLGLSDGQLKLVLGAMSLQENSDFIASKEGVVEGISNIKEIITGLALPGDKASKLTEAIDSAHHEAQNVGAADKAAHAIDAKLVAALDTHVRAGAGMAVKGLYAAAVDADEVAEAASLTKPDDQTIIGEFGAAFERVLKGSVDAGLAAEAKAISRAFIGGAQGATLQKALKADPKTAFEPLVALAERVLGAELSKLPKEKKEAISAGVLKSAFGAMARSVDQRLATVLGKEVDDAAGEAFAGIYAAQVKVDAAAKAAAAEPLTAKGGEAVIAAFANAFVTAFAHAAPDPSDKGFIGAGKALAAAFKNEAKADDFVREMGTGQGAALRLLSAAADKAVDSAIKSHAEALKTALKSPESKRALAAKAVYPDGGEEALKELEASDEEMAAYERQLVLIDEGGVAAAELQSIEKLIEQMQRDKLIADMILSAGGVLTGLGSSTTTIVGAVSVQVTDTLVSEIVGPLKAAKLIIKFAVAMKAANERRILCEKFKKSLKLSKNAVSPLQSTIQGFFDNKVEQITFRSIEDALTLVQIAAAVLGSVPEPITLAVGKTMGAVASAAESAHKVSEMIYNEVALSKAWTTTLAAMRTPRDRATGLKALRLNPTLGMHAIAWAGMEKKPLDPIARNLLGELGLNEQTLQVSGTDAKVRKYLETLLAEDRSMLDPDVISPKWIPKPLVLSTECWMVTASRAATLAEPKLNPTGVLPITDQLKKIDKHDVFALGKRAEAGAIEADEMQRLQDEAAELCKRLRAYAPVVADGSDHDEMANVGATFLKMANDHETRVRAIVRDNLAAQSHDVARVSVKLNERISALDKAILANKEDGLDAAFNAALETIREVQLAQLDEDDTIKPLYDSAMSKAKTASEALEALEAETT